MQSELEKLNLPPEIAKLIPFDKSWLMRLGLLDLLDGRDDMIKFLRTQKNLSTDLQALLRASKQWRENTAIDVGESGTLFRFLQFAAWSRGEDRKFIKRGTLIDRDICSDPTIVNLSLAELLKLDDGTTQWASAAILLGNEETPPDNTKTKLKLTYYAEEHWTRARTENQRWKPLPDITIAKQTAAYLHWKKSGDMIFTPEHAEDYCFARAFDLMTAKEGEARWPNLRKHESNRIVSMEEALDQQEVDSADHRVVQAVAMLKGDSVTFTHPECVSKSWPEFWQVIKLATDTPDSDPSHS